MKNFELRFDNPNQWVFHLAELGDAGKIANFAKDTFVETFGQYYKREDLQFHLDANYKVGSFKEKIQDPEHFIYLASDSTKELIGFLSLGRVKLPLKDLTSDDRELQQLYVLKQYHHKKIGFQLMQMALDNLKESSCRRLFLGVWENNFKAQKFYSLFGFQPYGEYLYPVGNHVDRELIWVKELSRI
jgi:ribosomal protein S18 acetylase RimI-like enzyme